MRTIALALCLLGTSLFAEEESQPAKDPHQLKPDHAPTPFSAEELRAGCPAGRVSIFRMENVNGQRALQVFHFITNDEKGADFEVAMLSADGQKQLSQNKARSTWAELQSHASYPKENTTRSEARIKTPAGTFDCWKYLVVERRDGTTTEKRYFFAKRIPGPPVKLTIHANGKQALDMMLVEHKDGTEAALLELLGFKGVAGASDEQKMKYAADFARLETREGTEADYIKARVREAEAAAIFKALDADADGKLTPAECVPAQKSDKLSGKLFRRLDHDADGSITLEELLKVTEVWARYLES